MAVCEHPSTSIYTDSGNPSHMNNLSNQSGTDTSSEGSAPRIILEATSSNKKKNNSKGIRRSSRLSKGRTDMTNHDSSDDDSDPNIDVGEVLLGDEEKLLIDEELRADKKRQKQMLAVALVKSAVESKGGSIKTIEAKDQHTRQQNSVYTTTQPCEASSQSNQTEISSLKTNEDTFGNSVDAPNNVVHGPTAPPSAPSVAVQVPSTSTITNVAAKVSTIPNATNGNVAVTKKQIATQKVPPVRANVTTRSRTRGAKAKPVGLKAQYASIRETPRYAPKPSLPVPNPILPSPAATSKASNSKIIVQQPLTRAATSKVKAHPASRSSKVVPVVKKEPLAMPPTASLPNNLLTGQTIKEPEGRMVSSHAPTPTKSNETITTNASVIPPARRRIFSIDLDPEGFDFDLSIGMSDYGDNSTQLPPMSSTTYGSRKHSDASAPSDMPLYRGRGMSFELFSFGNSGVLDTDMKTEALTGGRPRGDSIIFDPISFSDGGIHEETALQKTRGSFKLDESEELNLLNTTGFVEPSVAQPQDQQSMGTSQQSGQVRNAKLTRGHNSGNNIPNPVSSHTAQVTYTARGKARQTKGRMTTYHHKSGSKAKHHLTIVGGNSITGKEDTLHMPQGSAAAAAAAASLSSQILQSTMNGSISHTSCPMELLNKGGRIGIYLPEARRQRIAKFHSKRKNRIWRKRIKYDCRKKLADSRPRVKGRFVKSLDPEE